MDDCWRLAFAVAQWGQPKNPSKAEYGDDWEATARAYPHTAKQAQKVADDFNTRTELPVSTEWSPDHPYVRLCVPVRPACLSLEISLILYNESTMFSCRQNVDYPRRVGAI